MSQQQRQLFLTLRAALIMALNAVEDILTLQRSVPDRTERRKQLTNRV